MTPVAPASPVTPAAPAALAAVAPPAPNTNLPPGLANLTAGAILNGSVVGRDAQGHVIIQTPNGTLSLATALPLPQGTTLSLQVQTMGAQIQMVVLSINQQPQPQSPQAIATVILPAGPQGAKAGAPGAPLPNAPTVPNVPVAEPPAVTVTTGRVLTATVIEQAKTPAMVPDPGHAALPASAPLLAAALAGAAPKEGQPMMAALLGRPLRDGEAIAPTGTRLNVRIAALDTDPAGDPKNVMRAAAGDGRNTAKLLSGTVAEPDSGGLVQMKTPLGVLSLSTKIPFPAGSHVVLEVVGEPEIPLPAPLPESTPSQAGGWPALEEALAVLARDAADGADAPAKSPLAVPRLGPDLAPAILAAVVAIKTGDVRALVGDHILKALDMSGHHDLAVRLGQDFQQLSASIPDPAGGDWRSFLVPVVDGSHVQFLRFYLRKHKNQRGDDSDSDSTTRFLVEVDLTRMGAVQLDGLVKPKKFDLIIRSGAALDAGMRRDITKIFTDALAASGHAGALSFQASSRFASLPGRNGGAPVAFNV
jgi:hypothetical protein